MTRRPIHPRRTRGFTLVEAVMAVAIIGVVAAIVAVFIRVPILGYRDTVDRAELTDQADLALRRMARDIRLALPNSVRVSDAGDHLELLQTRSGARYLSADDGAGSLPVLSFDSKGSTSFTAVGMPGSFAQVKAGDYVVVYNLGPGFEPADAYGLAGTGVTGCPSPAAASGAGNIACINAAPVSATTSIDGQDIPTATITMAGNPFAYQDTPLQSPLQRFQVVSGPVSFYCAQNTDGRLALWRAWAYPIVKDQAVPTGGKRALVATGLTTCSDIFGYGTAASRRTGLVRIALSLRGRTEAPASIRLVHQVHVDNTP